MDSNMVGFNIAHVITGDLTMVWDGTKISNGDARNLDIRDNSGQQVDILRWIKTNGDIQKVTKTESPSLVALHLILQGNPDMKSVMICFGPWLGLLADGRLEIRPIMAPTKLPTSVEEVEARDKLIRLAVATVNKLIKK